MHTDLPKIKVKNLYDFYAVNYSFIVRFSGKYFPKLSELSSKLVKLAEFIINAKKENQFEDAAFFYIRVFFTDTDNSHDSRGREGAIFYSTLPLPPVHEHWDIFLQLCMWDDYHVFLIATLVFTRLLLDEVYHYRITIWVIDWWCNVCFFTWWIDITFLFQRFHIGD